MWTQREGEAPAGPRFSNGIRLGRNLVLPDQKYMRSPCVDVKPIRPGRPSAVAHAPAVRKIAIQEQPQNG